LGDDWKVEPRDILLRGAETIEARSGEPTSALDRTDRQRRVSFKPNEWMSRGDLRLKSTGLIVARQRI
jgi:hypothetical protein